MAQLVEDRRETVAVFSAFKRVKPDIKRRRLKCSFKWDGNRLRFPRGRARSRGLGNQEHSQLDAWRTFNANRVFLILLNAA